MIHNDQFIKCTNDTRSIVQTKPIFRVILDSNGCIDKIINFIMLGDTASTDHKNM